MLETVTLDQLRVFLVVCDVGSFSAAARRLNRAQSAVSYAVITLEKALGLALFDRAGRAPVLTEVGRTLAIDARAVIARADEMRARARSMAGDLEPSLSFAVDVFFPRQPLIAALKDFHREFPLLPLVVHSEGLSAVAKLVLDGVCHIGISVIPREIPVTGASLERRFLTSVEMVPVVASGHALARLDRPISTAELQDHIQLVLTDRSPLYTGFQGGVMSERVWKLADLGTKHDLLLGGFGWGNMPLHMVADDLACGRLKLIEMEMLQPPGPRNLSLAEIFRRSEPPGRAGQWLMCRLRALVGGSDKEKERPGK